jgi:hypothetical protein
VTAKPKRKPAPAPNPHQELFCRYFTQNEALFGNATLSYAEAYGFNFDELSHKCPTHPAKNEEEPDHECAPSEYALAYQTCSVNGSRLLRNAKVQALITKLLNDFLRDEVVDSQLAKLIMQDTEPAAKIAAIREYNKLRQRITEKVDHTSGGQPFVLPGEIIQKNNLGGTHSSAKGDRA